MQDFIQAVIITTKDNSGLHFSRNPYEETKQGFFQMQTV
jgi:hypothetical protein